MSRISIVIPMFNEARHIGRTLLAAQKAAFAANIDCELIVVDNGSTDEGPHIARQFGATVLVLPGLLIGALRNRGTAIATGEWLAFIDADIEMPEDWLKPLFGWKLAARPMSLRWICTPRRGAVVRHRVAAAHLARVIPDFARRRLAAQRKPVDAPALVRQSRWFQRNPAHR